MKKVIIQLVSGAILLGLVFIPASSTSATTGLSETGERAFQDLARCLNSKDTLDVFYLIDESSSLKDTDRENKRAPILAESLKSLLTLKEGLKINYAVGFFGREYSTWLPWSSLNSSNVQDRANKLEREIAARSNGQATDWLKGIEGARQELSSQRSKTKGCQILIWLTDGGMNPIGKADGGFEYFDELCDATFSSLRQSKVTVLGVLLRSEADLSSLPPDEREFQEFLMSHMLPLVEGSGTIKGVPSIGYPAKPKQCGKFPIPSNHSAGALLEAENPIALAYEFLRLSSLLGGGTTGAIVGNPGKFLIEDGVARFRIITTSSKWQLTNPAGQQVGPGSKIEIIKSGGATQITVPVDQSDLGEWKFAYESNSDNELVLFSGLKLQLDEGELVAGQSGSITGKVLPEFGNQPINLNVYGSSQINVQEVLGDGSVGPIRQAQLLDNNRFELPNYTPAANQGQVEVRVVLNIATRSGNELAPVSASRNLVVRLPENYPSLVNSPILFSPMKGINGEGKADAVFKGPKAGSGQVCFGSPRVLSDSIERSDSYEWFIDQSNLRDNCLDIAAGEQKSVSLSVKNGIPANASVLAELPLTYISDSEGKNFELAAPMEIPSETRSIGWIIALLVALGFALPLLALYLLTLYTTKIAMGESIQRGEWQVKVDSMKGIVGADGNSIKPVPEDFRFIATQGDSRSVSDQVGEMRARTSKLVFPAPWFEVDATEGNRLITMSNGPAGAAKRFKSGKIAPISGNIDKVWLLSIRDEDLRNLGSSTSIPGRLVIFKRNNLANKNQYMERFLQVVTTAGIWNQIQQIANVVSAESQLAENKQKTKKSKKASKPARDKEGEGTTSPPPPPGNGFPTPPSGSGTTPPPASSPPSGPAAPKFPPPPPGSGGLPPKPPGA